MEYPTIKAASEALQFSAQKYILSARRTLDMAYMVVRHSLNVAPAIQARTHPFGFVHLQLASFDRFKLRLHIWPPREVEPEPPMWLVHNHTFDFESLLLSGRLLNTQYRVEETKLPPAQHAQRLFAVRHENDDTVLIATDQGVAIFPENVEEILAGSEYSMRAHAFHTSHRLGTSLAATLLVLNPHAQANSYLIGLGTAGMTVRRAPLTPPGSDVQQLLRELITSMERTLAERDCPL